MKINYIIVFLSILLLNACQDPSGLDANREISVIYDPNNKPPQFRVEPEEVDFGLVHPGKTYQKTVKIINITNQVVPINSIAAKNYFDYYSFSADLPISLSPKGSANESSEITISFESSLPADYTDQINWVDYKNPRTKIIAKVASVWGNDLLFEDTKVGSFDLKVLNIINSSSVNATITSFEIIDNDNAFLIEPAFVTPQIIDANSSSRNIFVTFNPNGKKDFNAQIRITVDYGESGNHFTDQVIELNGKGVN